MAALLWRFCWVARGVIQWYAAPVTVAEALSVYISLLAVINPLVALPVLLVLTEDQPIGRRRRAAVVSAAAVLAILIGSIWFGQIALDLFGIRVASLRVGGGLLLLLMAIAMMHSRPSRAKQTPEEQEEAATSDSFAIVPLALPIMAGPGTISLMISTAVNHHELDEMTLLSAIAVGVAVTILVVLVLGEKLMQRVGVTGLNVTTRLMGLVLAAVAVEMMAAGLTELFPVLSSTG